MIARSSGKKPVIALVPIGKVSPAAIEALISPVGEAFGAEVVVAHGLELPSSAWDGSREQYLSTALLDRLAGMRRPEWERVLGTVDVDLYVPRLNFVFGEGDSNRGVGVFSLARLHSSDEVLFRRRAATEAIHELGHTFGLAHCDDPHCVMWFSNTLAESDRKGTRFCRRHAAELTRTRGAR